jgi:hypothetical protein
VQLTIPPPSPRQVPSSQSHVVLQFHYTKWPDYGTPKLAAPLLNFLRAVHSSNPPDAGPILVHCSAGVGRSGTVICIDYCLAKLKADRVIDVRGFVSRMREHRNYMVQTEVYTALWETYCKISTLMGKFYPEIIGISLCHRRSMPSSTTPSWRPSPTETLLSLSPTSPRATRVSSRRARRQGRRPWRRSTPDWAP